MCAKKFILWNHRWWFMWWCSSPVYIITNLIWFDKYPKYHIYKSSINMISIRTIMIISWFMIYSAVNHSYDSKRTIKIISGIITMIYLSNRTHFLWVYCRDNPRGMLGEHEKSVEWFTSFSSVLPTSKVGYHASKPIESSETYPRQR